MSKSNTLFSYFQKSPKGNSSSSTTPSVNGTPSGKHTPKIETPKSYKGAPLNSFQSPQRKCEHEPYDIVWAKLEGYPYWPALVCSAPGSTDGFTRGNKIGSEVHVQFFDQPPSTSWIKEKFIKAMTGAKHPEVPSMKDGKWKEGVEQACKALEMERGQRSSLVVAQAGSDKNEDQSLSDDQSDAENDHRLSNQKKRPREMSATSKPKRRRIIVESDNESGDEYKPDVTENISSDDEADLSLHDTDDEPALDSDNEPSPVKTPPSKAIKKKPKSTPLSFSSSKTTLNVTTPVRDTTKSKLASFASEEGGQPRGEGKVWTHLKLEWLKPERLKDINGNPLGSPDYDPRTILVPSSFKQGLTPAMRQWWEMKSTHYDTVLFFKVGKFYELYHMDAVIGINELNLREMAGEYAHSGFPEISYGRYSSMLIEKGYKVARVEQTETPQMMEERCKKMSKPTKFDKVVNREICALTTKGTRTFGVQDGEAVGAGNNYLLGMAEKEKPNGDSLYGVCFVDTSIGKFYLGQFSDDRHCSRFRTLIAHFPPAQVLFERNHSSNKTQTVLSGCLISAVKESLRSGSEFWDSSKTLKQLHSSGYFNAASSDCSWPSTIKKMIDSNDTLNQTASEQYDLAVRALGACTWYLKRCHIDEELLSMKNFEEYIPPDNENERVVVSQLARQHMVLDAVSLLNMEVLENSLGGSEGSLLRTMENCSTPFGKRLFRQWMCSPLCNPEAINDRLNAIEDLQQAQGILEDVTKTMKKLPDLERLLSRIHAQGSARRSEDHPDSRAVFYEEGIYTKRKIADLLNALQGFKTALEVNHLIHDPKFQYSSNILKDVILKEGEGGRFPHLKDVLHFFDNAFDHNKAKADGKIVPSKGVDEDFDTAEKEISESKKRLDQYLEKQRKHFGCKVTYFNSGKNRFQLEVPEHACKRASNSYELVSQKKGFKRFWTSDIKNELPTLTSAEDRRETALKDIMRRIFNQFDKHYKKWECAVSCLSVLDVLLSLVHYYLNSQVTMCRPIFRLPSSGSVTPYLRIKDGSHPALIKFLSGGDFIPNDISIGSPENPESSRLLLVTGPNMGGKSTLMRQAGLLAIMAQMGSFVPAEEFELTPVDRVFTRLGASDRILEGESTFFVELSETASILKHATEHSLVLLDELGRGTATYDGTAIACAVAENLASQVRCRTLFSTHYHTLVDHFSKNPYVELGHMSCMVENENEDDPTQETITFLYKFVGGACPKSYGFNAARLAGIPDQIIRDGYQKAREFEEKSNRLKMLRLIFTSSKSSDLKTIQRNMTMVQ